MKKAVVLHCDILGFKAIIAKSAKNRSDADLIKIKAALKESIDGALKLFVDSAYVLKNVDVTYKIFSDNIYVSFSYDEADNESFSGAFIFCLIFSRGYFATMLDNEFLVRGAISSGDDYSDEQIIYSHALVKAYLLEDKKAIYPRIVIDDELINLLREGKILVSGPIMFKALNNSILIDKDNLHFLNPMELAQDFDVSQEGYSPIELSKGFTNRYLQFLSAEMKKEEILQCERVMKKHVWLTELLIWILTDRRKQGTMDKFSSLNLKRI